MKAITGWLLVTIGLAATFLYGCGDDKAMMSNDTQLVTRSIPSSGETSYDPAASIHIKFSTAMDTSQFRERFFFLGAEMHDAMHDSLDHGMMKDSTTAVCDLMAHPMMGGGMDQMMGGRNGGMGRNGFSDEMMGQIMVGMMDHYSHMTDTAAFYRGMHDRRQSGTFQWNPALDSCVFTPDSPMMDDRDYVIMMRSMNQSMRNGQHGSMMGDDDQDMMIRFHTR